MDDKTINEIIDALNKWCDSMKLSECNDWEIGYRKGLKTAARLIKKHMLASIDKTHTRVE